MIGERELIRPGSELNHTGALQAAVDLAATYLYILPQLSGSDVAELLAAHRTNECVSLSPYPSHVAAEALLNVAKTLEASNDTVAQTVQQIFTEMAQRRTATDEQTPSFGEKLATITPKSIRTFAITATTAAVALSGAMHAAAEPIDNNTRSEYSDSGISLVDNDVTANGTLEQPAQETEVEVKPVSTPPTVSDTEVPVEESANPIVDLLTDGEDPETPAEEPATEETPPAVETEQPTAETETPPDTRPEPVAEEQEETVTPEEPKPVEAESVAPEAPATPQTELESALDNMFTPEQPSITVRPPEEYAEIAEDAVKAITDNMKENNEKAVQEGIEQLQEDLGELGATLAYLDVLKELGRQQFESQQTDQPAKEKQSSQEDTPEPEKEAKEPTADDEEKGENRKLSKYNKLFNVIAKFESGGNYNAYYGNAKNQKIDFTAMSIGEVMQWQRDFLKKGSPSTAIGKYQFLNGTLKSLVKNLNIPKSQKFDKELQDKFALSLLKKRGLNSYLKGKISDKEFAHNLSKEWAALPRVIGENPEASYYAGDGLNKSHVKIDNILEAVRSIKDKPAEKTVAPSKKITKSTVKQIRKSSKSKKVANDKILMINKAIKASRTYPVAKYSDLPVDADAAEYLREARYPVNDSTKDDCLKNITAWTRVSFDKKFNPRGQSTTQFYRQIMKDGASAVGTRNYKIIKNPSMKDLQPGDILLVPGHAALYTGDIIGKDGKKYQGIEAALGSDRTPSPQDGDQMVGWIQGQGDYIAIRLVG